MRHTKSVSAAVVAVMGLVGAGCSSGGDSSPEMVTTGTAVGNVATTETVARPDTTDTTTTFAPAAPGTERVEPVPSAETAGSAETAPSASSSGSAPQGTSETPGSTTTAAAATASATTTTTTTSAAPPTTTTSTPATTTTTTTTVPSADDLRVQVLNGSGISGAAGRLTERLEEAGYDMLPAGNAPRRYAVSAVYYSHDVLEDQAAEIAVATGVGGVVSLAMPSPAPFVVEGADVYVVVLIGADDLGGSLRPPARASGLRPRQRNDVQLPLPDSTPRDRYVPGLADINIYSQINDQGTLDLQAKLEELSIFLRYIGNYQPYVGATAENRDTNGTFREVSKLLEDTLSWLGFTPQNVCGAPAGYTFTDLLQPTREWSDEFKVHRGEAIFTTDRLLELHGGTRINPSENLGFYIREAVQTAHDALRLAELSDETEAPQMILCDAWKLPEGEIPEAANGYWYALLTPGIQPRESLLSQGTYHVKEISRNGNFAYLIVCHPAIGARFVALHWREAGYRAEVVEGIRTSGCQAAFEEYDSYFAGTTPDGSGDYFTEDTISFGFGERVFSASDLLPFPSVRY